MKRKHTMFFDKDSNQWFVEMTGRSYPMHCGESFLLYMGKTAFPCRLELDTSWYVILPNISFALHCRTTYLIAL